MTARGLTTRKLVTFNGIKSFRLRLAIFPTRCFSPSKPKRYKKYQDVIMTSINPDRIRSAAIDASLASPRGRESSVRPAIPMYGKKLLFVRTPRPKTITAPYHALGDPKRHQRRRSAKNANARNSTRVSLEIRDAEKTIPGKTPSVVTNARRHREAPGPIHRSFEIQTASARLAHDSTSDAHWAIFKSTQLSNPNNLNGDKTSATQK
jgi:hypothetical protein